jgi:plastocyanin
MRFLKYTLFAAFTLSCLYSGRAVAGDAAVSGKVSLDLPAGKKPGRKKLQMAADPVCAGKHTDAPALSEVVVVNDDGTLRNVFVYVKAGLEGKKFDVPAEPAVLDQNGCMYKPHVLGVRAGQPIKILNSDGTLHNIHPKPKVNAEFNMAMPKFLKVKTKTFEKAEVMIPIKCDVHPWMQSYVGVLDHPFFFVTGEGGAFELTGLTAGTYTLEAWHERLGSQTREVTVKDGETATVDFTFQIPKKKKS